MKLGNFLRGVVPLGIMKRLACFIPLLSLSAFLLTGAGCANVRPVSPQTWQILARSAARDGSEVYLARHPQTNNVAAFRAAKVALDLMIADGHFSASELHSALSNLPVKELKGDTGIISVDAATVIYVALTGGESTIAQSVVVEAFAIGIRDGLQVTLSQYP